MIDNKAHIDILIIPVFQIRCLKPVLTFSCTGQIHKIISLFQRNHQIRSHIKGIHLQYGLAFRISLQIQHLYLFIPAHMLMKLYLTAPGIIYHTILRYFHLNLPVQKLLIRKIVKHHLINNPGIFPVCSIFIHLALHPRICTSASGLNGNSAISYLFLRICC